MPSTLGIVSSHYTRPIVPVSLLLQGNETPIRDSLNKNSVTAYGNATISTSVKKYGSGSLYFDGNGDYLTIPATSALAFGTGDFTIEAWIYPTSNVIGHIVSLQANSSYYAAIRCLYNDTGYELLMSTTGSSWTLLTGKRQSGTMPVNVWSHIAVVRQSTNIQVFINGSLVDTHILTGALMTASGNSIGGLVTLPSQNPFQGYIDDLRITRGAIYTKNFAPGPLSELPTTDPINLNLL